MMTQRIAIDAVEQCRVVRNRVGIGCERAVEVRNPPHFEVKARHHVGTRQDGTRINLFQELRGQRLDLA